MLKSAPRINTSNLDMTHNPFLSLQTEILHQDPMLRDVNVASRPLVEDEIDKYPTPSSNIKVSTNHDSFSPSNPESDRPQNKQFRSEKSKKKVTLLNNY